MREDHQIQTHESTTQCVTEMNESAQMCNVGIQRNFVAFFNIMLILTLFG